MKIPCLPLGVAEAQQYAASVIMVSHFLENRIGMLEQGNCFVETPRLREGGALVIESRAPVPVVRITEDHYAALIGCNCIVKLSFRKESSAEIGQCHALGMQVADILEDGDTLNFIQNPS